MRANAGAKSPSCSRTAVCLSDGHEHCSCHCPCRKRTQNPSLPHSEDDRPPLQKVQDSVRTISSDSFSCSTMHDPHGSRDSKTPAGAEPAGVRKGGVGTLHQGEERVDVLFGRGQLVARRTIVWLSSGFSQKLMPTFSERVWYLSSGSLTKVWFVVELKRS